MNRMVDILTVSDVSVAFGDETAIDRISLSLGAGDALAIIGPNGAGKSVFLRTLLGTVPYRGTITWAPDTRIGYVPQKIDADRHLPVNFRNLLTAKAALLALTKKDVDTVVKAVGLDVKIMETSVGHLSGGQFQRALIAFALLGKPNVLILDEPTASIDKPGEEQMYELVHRLQDQYAMTVILVSHDLSFVYRYATKVLCLNKTGLCFGAPEEALMPKILEELYGSHKYFHYFHHPSERHPDKDRANHHE
jgi:zinc transport system ATP-binding protein